MLTGRRKAALGRNLPKIEPIEDRQRPNRDDRCPHRVTSPSERLRLACILWMGRHHLRRRPERAVRINASASSHPTGVWPCEPIEQAQPLMSPGFMLGPTPDPPDPPEPLPPDPAAPPSGLGAMGTGVLSKNRVS